MNFLSYEIVKVVFEKPLNFVQGDFKVSTAKASHVQKEDKDDFLVDLLVEVTPLVESGFMLVIQAMGHFKITGEPTDEIRNNYVNFSGPAILYPYLRAFITTMVVQAGMRPLLLPAMDFTVK